LPEDDKTLPKDSDSDYSLPGRFEESNSDFDIVPVESKPRNRTFLAIVVVFVVFSAGVFLYYFANQDEIDSRILQGAFTDPEQNLVNQYGVGEYGSDHAHAAITVFVDGEQLNFGLPQFQLSSRYIHLEGHNPYVIHKHATGVPLDMLFASFGMKITTECIMLNYESADIKTGKFCSGQDQSLAFFVNGEEYYSDISQYEIEHYDRILVSFGDTESISGNLAYLESLRIPDIPKKTPQFSGNEINL